MSLAIVRPTPLFIANPEGTAAARHRGGRAGLAAVLTAVLVALLALMLGGCKDSQKEAVVDANKSLDAVLPLVARDTKQLREGVPEGAKVLSKHLDKDPGSVPEGLRRTLVMTRAGVDNLVVAKGNFFIFVAPDGVVQRGESDPDLAVGESLFKAIPAAKAIMEPGDKAVEVFGFMHGLRGVQNGDDLQWVLGSPVLSEGKVIGAFVSGWSLRHYANVLEGLLRIELRKVAKDPGKAIPLAYMFVVKGSHAYGAAVTPDDNAKVVGEMDIPNNLKDGKFSKTIELGNRTFTVLGRPLPSLGDDTAAALMISGL